MKWTWLLIALPVACCSTVPVTRLRAEEVAIPNVVLGVHGGTGGPKKEMTPELEKKLRAGLERALKAGYAVLTKPDGTSLDAVEAAIRVLEDDEWFNAGKGAAFTHDGRNELDASIMEGSTKKGGAVASVTVVKNPISAARAVMEKSKHVLLVGRGAELFVERSGLEIVDPKYFWTQHRWDQLQRELERERQAFGTQTPEKNGPRRTDEERSDEGRQAGAATASPRRADLMKSTHEWSTVGAVAIDSSGNLAAGTSTGGRTNKLAGRVGDSPILGAGTYADSRTCAVSCTGHGEYFIRLAVAHDIAALMEYKGLAVEKAADEVIQRKLRDAGGEGAAIALDPKGNFAMSYNTGGLHRGYVTSDGKITVLLYEN